MNEPVCNAAAYFRLAAMLGLSVADVRQTPTAELANWMAYLRSRDGT